MPRNASGNYTLPAGNPVVTGTTIASTWANPTLQDVGTELQDSLSRTGKGAMLAPLKHTSGSAAAPSVTFNAETQSGWYRAGANDIRLSVGGVDAIRFENSQLQLWVPATSSWFPIVSTRTAGGEIETQTLSALQTVVPFTLNVAGAALYLDGTSGDRGRLLLDTDYTYDSVANEVTLSTDYPAGTNLFAVVNDETDIIAAAQAAADSANAAAASESAAASSESAAATSESNAATSETNAANSASAASTSASNAATSESNAATSESNAATSETNAANSASAASTSASNAATSESNAATSESNAAASESAAATSASNAADSETAAAASESAAATSASEAATSASEAAADAATIADTTSRFAREDLLREATLVGNFAANTYEVYEGITDGMTQRPFGDIFDFARDSKATGRTAINGLQQAIADAHRLVGNREGLLIEEERTNLIEGPRELANPDYWDQVFNQATPNAAKAVDGTLNATRLNVTSSGPNRSRQNLTISGSTTYTFSAFFKKGQSTGALLRLRDSFATDGLIIFDTNDGSISVSSGDDFGLVDYGEWWRAYVVSTSNGTSAEIRIEAGGEEQDIDWAVLEEGSFPTSPIVPDTTFTSRAGIATALNSEGTLTYFGVDEARDDAYGYDSDGILRPIGLLLEEARTNLLSEYIRTYSRTDISYTASTDPKFPDAQIAEVVSTGTDEGAIAFGDEDPAAAAGDPNYRWFYIKPVNVSSVIVTHRGANDGFAMTADFSTATLSGGNDVSNREMVDIGDGWWLVSFRWGTTSNGLDDGLYVRFDSPSTGDKFEIGGMQVEVGEYRTSLIPTAGSTVTRAADVSSSPAATRAADDCSRTLGQEFNASSVTVYIDATLTDFTNNVTVFSVDDGTIDNRLQFSSTGSNNRLLVEGQDSPVIFDFASSAEFKAAISYNGITGDTVVVMNGVSDSGTAGAGGSYTVANFAKNATGSGQPDQIKYRDFRIIPRALTASELETLTGGN